MPNDLNDAYLNRIKASMIDSFTDFISIAGTDRRIIYFNPAAYKMMGYGPDERPEILGTAELHAEGFDEFAKEVIQPSVFKNGSWTGVSAIRHKDGSTIVVEMTVFPLYSPEGEEWGTVAVMRDVNEMTKMNRRLQKSTELFQKVLDSAKIGIVLINMESNTIEMVNKFTEELLQIDAAEVLGKKCYNVLCRSKPELCPHINERDKQILLAERYITRKDGSTLPIIKTGTWITLDDKEYLVDTFVDISIQKELEKNLQDAKIAAEAANRSKSEFLSRMSHEMRTPLNAVIGMTRIAEKTNDVQRLLECINTIRLSSNHLLSLINDVLDLSKIEEGKLELNLEAFSLAAMVWKIVPLIEQKLEEKRIDFRLRVDEKLPEYLHGDALRLSQVLLNFLSNAVKFTPENAAVSMDVLMRERRAHEVDISFSVADAGIGMTPEQLGRLFKPFTQADGSISGKYGGTGLGLVISRRIVNLMGSDIAVESAPGEGTSFSFTLTLPIADDLAPELGEAAGEDAVAILKGKKVLLVDDVDLNRMIAVELLAETGLVFDEAANGREAVEKATRSLYDFIFMDIQMPEMDGYEATRNIRGAKKPYCDTPIIAMSANVFKEDVERSLAEGMNAHTGKPLDVEKLLSIMAGILRKPGAAPKAAGYAAAFTADGEALARNANYFDYAAALALHSGDASALASLCAGFIGGDHWEKLHLALEFREYDKAEEVIDLLIRKSRELVLPALAAYAGNVKENIEKKDYDYAVMYANDLGRCWEKTREVLNGLLQTRVN